MNAPDRFEVLRRPHVARAMLTGLLARMPMAMATLAILLIFGPGRGYAKAGLICAVYVAGSAVTNPVYARLVDRFGARRIIPGVATINSAGLCAVALFSTHTSLMPSAFAAVIGGLAAPPITAVVRGLWPAVVPGSQVQVLYGLEATAQELVYISGPALVAGLSAAFGPRTALMTTAALGLMGSLALVTSPIFASPATAITKPRVSPLLRSRRVWAWLVLGAALTTGFGVTEIGVVAFVAPGRPGGSGASGLVLAVWSLGSMIGGVAFGRRHRNVGTEATLVSAVAIATLTALPAVAPDDVALAVGAFLAGFAIAPGLARLYARVSDEAGDRTQTEAFGWLAVAFIIGSAAGSTIGGILVDGLGARAALALAAAGPFLGVVGAAILLRGIDRSAGAETPAAPAAAPVASPT